MRRRATSWSPTPAKVLIFVIQDEGSRPRTSRGASSESGLIDFVYAGAVRALWPTLREMVESDQRVLVMAENDTDGVDWYHPAFEVMQETPYAFHDPSEFSNRPNRGGSGGSLMLLEPLDRDHAAAQAEQRRDRERP